MRLALTKLEREVMGMLLAGEHPFLRLLTDQFALSTVANRELTGVGFFTRFHVPENAPRLRRKDSFCFGDVGADIRPLNRGAGFLLWIREGILDFLEAYTYDEPWPEDVDEFTLQYDGGQRNLEAVVSRLREDPGSERA